MTDKHIGEPATGNLIHVREFTLEGLTPYFNEKGES
jgi:hypothetical protein